MACAYFTKTNSVSIRLPDGFSIFSAEAKAVNLALDKIETSYEKYMIFTDSLSLIQSIENRNLKNPIIGSIIRRIHELRLKNNEIRFCWVASHCGIAGNEHADLMARRALNYSIHHFLFPYSDKIPMIKKYLISKWQRRWNQANDDYLQEIKPVIGPPFLVHSCRKDQVVLNRIRLGSTRLTHSFLMEGKDKPNCIFCHSNIPISVKHVILYCSHFSHIRAQHFRNVQNMKDLFDLIDVKNILGFLKETAIYQKT